MPAATMPQASARFDEEAGGSTATTMRISGGAASHPARFDHVARPERIGAVLDDVAVEFLPPEPRAGIAAPTTVSRKAGARFAALSDVRARDDRDASGRRGSRLSSGIGRGVVVTSWRGCAPRRRPNCSMSQVSSTCAIWRVRRPRRPRIAARAGCPGLRPRTHGRRRRSAIRACAGTATRRAAPTGAHGRQNPAGPSTITSRAAAKVSPTRARRDIRSAEASGSCRTRPRTHSAPARVLPAAAPTHEEPDRPGPPGNAPVQRTRKDLPVAAPHRPAFTENSPAPSPSSKPKPRSSISSSASRSRWRASSCRSSSRLRGGGSS